MSDVETEFFFKIDAMDKLGKLIMESVPKMSYYDVCYQIISSQKRNE